MEHKEIFDYAPLLLKIDSLAKTLHTACLSKRLDAVPSMCDALVVEARMLRGWALDQQEANCATAKRNT
jgi:hypothetical protein